MAGAETSVGVRRGLRGFVEPLLPVAPPARITPSTTAALCAAVALGVLASLLRQPGAPAWDTMWAEDGGRFLGEALAASHPFAPLLEPYAGYLHVWPRLVSGTVALLPLQHAALATSVLAALGAAALGAVCFVAARAHLPSPWLRAALGALFVLVPIAAVDTANIAASTQYLLVAAGFWALLWRPQRPGGLVIACVVVLLAATSAPAALVLCGVAIARLVVVRGREIAPSITYLVGAVGHVAVVVANYEPREVTSVPLNAATFVQRMLVPGVIGHQLTAGAWLFAGWVLVGFVAVVVVAIVVSGVLSGPPSRQWLAGVAGITGVAAGAMAVVGRDAHRFMLWPEGEAFMRSQRLGVSTALLVAAALAAALHHPPAEGARRPWRVLAGVVGAAMAVAVVLDFAPESPRSDGPRWREQVVEASASCEPGDEVRLEHSPPGWALTVDCEDLRR